LCGSILAKQQVSVYTMLASVRIDKWLWATRLFKTRALATEACKGGKVSIDGQPLKPSRELRGGETVTVRSLTLTRTVKVLGLVDKRVGPKLVAAYLQDLTPAEEYLKAMQQQRETAAAGVRPKGSGRPTKKERRQLDRLQ
jgi:ribosome-associated heat shock protein Hsp15